MWRVHGVFAMRTDLRSFPFDRTELEIQVSASRSVRVLRLVENTASPSILQTGNFMLGSGWHLLPAITVEAGATPAAHSRSGTSRPLAIARLYMDRKAYYFVLNIMMPMGVVSPPVIFDVCGASQGLIESAAAQPHPHPHSCGFQDCPWSAHSNHFLHDPS